jgi:hypothetical protein
LAPTNNLQRHTHEFLARDFLSPTLLFGLFPDFFQLFLPIPIARFDRALGLEYGFEAAWDGMVERLGKGGLSNNPFAADFLNHWDPKGNAPALVLNATRVGTGQRLVISPFQITRSRVDTIRELWQFNRNLRIRLSTAVGLSARFPVVSPTGWFEGTEQNWLLEDIATKVDLADGGYFDNSGSDTAIDIVTRLRELIQLKQLHIDVHLILINDASFASDELLSLEEYNIDRAADPQKARQDWRDRFSPNQEYLPKHMAPTQGLGEFLSPFGTLLSGRTQRGLEATRSALIQSEFVHVGFDDTINGVYSVGRRSYIFPISTSNVDLPVGWLMSPLTIGRIVIRAGARKGCGYSRFILLPPVKIMADYGEDFRLGPDISAANCALESILILFGNLYR